MKSFRLLLIGLITFIVVPTYISCAAKVDADGFPAYNLSEYYLMHIFRDIKGNELGRAYVKALNDDVFSSLVIVKSANGINKTLYVIDRNTFISIRGVDTEAYSPGFYGYRVVLKKNDYIVLTYLRNSGKNVSDDITIEWNYDEQIFQVMKAP